MARILASACALSSACLIQSVTTEVRVRDPARVEIASATGDVVLPSGDAPTEAPLGAARADMGEGASAAYSVRAHREPDRSITMEWDTRVPISNGERTTVIPADGVVSFDKPASELFSPETLSQKSLSVRWCTSLTRRYNYRGGPTFSIEPRSCSERPYVHPIATVDYRFDAEWRDVTIIEHARPDHHAAQIGVTAATITFGAIAAMIFAFPSSSFHGGATTKYILGGGTVAIMLGFDLPLLKTLLTSDRDTVVAPR